MTMWALLSLVLLRILPISSLTMLLTVLPVAPPGNAVIEKPVLRWTEVDYDLYALASATQGRQLIRDLDEWDSFLASIPPEFSDLSLITYAPDDPYRMPDFDGNVAVFTETSSCGGHFVVDAFPGGEVAVRFVETDPGIVCEAIHTYSVFEVPLADLEVSSADEVTLRS